MPISPEFVWEQTNEVVTLRVTIKGVKKDKIDVFISDTFLKINAEATYLLQLDLLRPIDVQRSGFLFDLPQIKISLPKQTAEAWDTLCIDDATPSKERQRRRKEALARAEQMYNMKLDTREQLKTAEKKRMFNEQWELDKEQRADIENKRTQEREREQQDLYDWEDKVQKRASTPGDIVSAAPARRLAETKTVEIEFSRGTNLLPSRSRGDEDHYRKSRYKPVSVEDAPMFWKEKGDKLYRARDFRGAVDAYSESVKRDGCFLTCISNRAACYLQLHEYGKAVEDCDLAITILGNTPAGDTSHEQYTARLCKLHTRRAAAYCWQGSYSRGMDDYRVAAAYKGQADEESGILEDLKTLEDYMRRHSVVETRDEISDKRSEANRVYFNGKYERASEMYLEIIQCNEFDVKSRSNLASAYLQMGMFNEALEQCTKVIEFCQEVAQALGQPGAQSAAAVDSDDEDECADEFVAKRNEAARTLKEKSGHVYLLLKAFVRAGAAYCGLNEYKKAFDMFEMALKITPYDDDLRDDANRILEKLKMDTIIGASQRAQQQDQPPNDGEQKSAETVHNAGEERK